MTDGLSMQTCPKCGKENLAHMTHCVHCGNALEAMFSFEGQIELPEDVPEESAAMLPLIFEEMQSAPEILTDDIAQEDFAEEETQEKSDPNVPDWLQRVRQRARAEEDASGELIKGIQSMQDMVNGEEKGDAESEYQAWLDEVRENASREKAKRAARLRPSPLDEQGVPEWLRRIRALNPDNADNNEEEEAQDEWTEEALEELRRQELGDAYVPKDLAQKDEDELLTETPEEEIEEAEIEHNIPEDDEDLDPDTGRIQSGADATPDADEPTGDETGFVMVGEPKLDPQEVFDTESVDDLASAGEQVESDKAKKAQSDEEKEAILRDLVILRGQHEKVALLKSLISAEGQPSPSPSEPEPKKRNRSHLLIGLAFILILLLAIIIIPQKPITPEAVSGPQKRFDWYLEQVKADDRVLLVISYASASAPELESLSAPVLKQIEEKGAESYAITLRMDGLWLAQSLYEKAGLDHVPVTEYVPGGQFAMLDLAVRPQSKKASTQQNSFQESTLDIEDFDLILLITDSSFTARGWFEQVTPNIKYIHTLAIISQKEAVAIQPYFDSTQVLGYLTGMQGLPGKEIDPGTHFRVFQVGLIMTALLLVLGLILRHNSDKPVSAMTGEQA